MCLPAQQYSPDEFFGESPEVYFTFRISGNDQIEKISTIISIDHVKEDRVWAYANRQEFGEFLQLHIDFKILEHPGRKILNPKMLAGVDISAVESWDFYPTWDAYLDMMAQFAADYPEICQLVNFGSSEEGRDLIAVKISDNITTREAEPQFLYTGTIHGDETAGYILLLRLIDHLLTNYGSDPDITGLINQAEIWINPLSNPDGTYAGGNHTVYGATRYNANGVDLNRNYPDPDDGPHPDGNDWQAETLAFMQLAEDEHFVMSANTHGGAEVINYPWDTWQHLTADDDWWVYVCREYADTVHVYAPWYYLDGFENGITNGYAWYTISGGRQDYMNFFHHCREVTMELSNTKLLPTSQLNSHWEWNYRSLINYFRQCTFGVAGVITDVDSGMPLHAEVFIENHDQDESQVWTDPETGFYQRLLEAGTYDLTFSAPGYMPLTIENVMVSRYETVNLDVQLDAGSLVPDFSVSETIVPAGSSVDFADESWGNPVLWEWQFQGGNPPVSAQQHPAGIIYQSPGTFGVSLTVTNALGESETLFEDDLIIVAEAYTMSDQSLELCCGLLYDSGGPSANYANNEDLTMTINPAATGSMLRLDFLEFSLESHSTCNYDRLNIYDGSSVTAPLIGTYCGSDSPGTVVANNPEGALTLVFHSDNSITKPGWKALASCYLSQQVALSAGWNSLSLFLSPGDPDFESILSDIMGQVTIVVGDEGVIWPEENINSLGNWNRQEGYWIKMQNQAILNTSGTLLTGQILNLEQGWNFVPVPSPCEIPVNLLTDALGDSLVLVKDAAGWQLTWPEKNVSTLQKLIPGSGYLILMSEPAAFVIPDCE
ncbi:MAG: M14 family zinc carboxypeptidase [Bacteroidales bacterium]